MQVNVLDRWRSKSHDPFRNVDRRRGDGKDSGYMVDRFEVDGLTCHPLTSNFQDGLLEVVLFGGLSGPGFGCRFCRG